MSKRIFFLFLCVLPALSLKAQHPGYMGKRFTVGGEFAYGYTGFEFTPFNVHYGVFGSFILTRKLQLCFTGTNYNNKLSGITGYGYNRLSGYSAMLEIRFYRSKRIGAIAPIGKYIDVGLCYSDFTLHPRPGSLNLQNEPYLKIEDNAFMPYFGFGIQTVFFDCITADSGMRFGTYPFGIAKENSNFRRNVYEKFMVNFFIRIGYQL
jgi:hypothetical protein